MTTPPNIDRFNKITLLTLDTLYQAFPVPKTLDVATLALETLPPDTEFDDSFQSIEVAYWVVDFLVTEGFITHKGATIDGKSFALARLTSKSLAVLGSTPSALEHQQTIAERIRALLKTGAKQAASDGAKKLIEALFSNAPAIVNLVSEATK